MKGSLSSAPLPITDSNLAGGEENFIPLSRGGARAGGDFRGDFCCKQGATKTRFRRVFGSNGQAPPDVNASNVPRLSRHLEGKAEK